MIADVIRALFIACFFGLALLLPGAIGASRRDSKTIWLLICVYAIFAAGIQAMILEAGHPLKLVYIWRLIAVVAGFIYVWKVRRPARSG